MYRAIPTSEQQEAFKASVLAQLTYEEGCANAKRWAKTNGYYGAQGGFIYNANHKPIVQGWRAFFHHFRFLILADVQSGAFKITRSRKA